MEYNRARQSKKCVLAVDDVAIILSRITDALEGHYNVVTVNSGVRALKYLDKNKPDLILLDLWMPELNGFDILQLLQARPDWKDIPVIVLTGVEDKDSIIKGIEYGIRDYILKPFDQNDLLERVQRVLEGNGHHENAWRQDDFL